MATAPGDAQAPGGHIPWRWILLAWLFPAVIATLQSAAGYATRGALAAEWPYAALQFPRWMLWAAVTPLVFAAWRRYPVARPGLGRAIGRHLMFSVGLSVALEALWLPANVLVSIWLNPGVREAIPWASVFVLAVLGRIVPGALTYTAILGVAATLESREALRRREVAASQVEAQLVRTQLDALKMQVHPHFLFNTLQTITVLVDRDPRAATRMVTRLGDLLRLTLARARTQEVSLARELEVVRLYLEIEEVRFPGRLAVHLDAAPDTLPAAVPDLLLQPLVENAIKHGIAPSASPGEIRLTARRDGDRLVLVVRNSGKPAVPSLVTTDGVGLSVTKARLQGLYGHAHQFTFAPLPAGGAEVTVAIPWREEVTRG